MWAAKTPNGPSIKLHVQNVHTMDELKMTGNCLKGSRGLLSFDKGFDDTEWGRLTKELFTHVSCQIRGISSFDADWIQIFGVPATARKAKPFIDHILTFSILDSKIWFRNFQVCRSLLRVGTMLTTMTWQIMEKDPAQPNGPPHTTLVEIGPRFVLTPIRIFEGAFGGATVFSNPGMLSRALCLCFQFLYIYYHSEFVSPAAVRSAARRSKGDGYRIRKEAEEEAAKRKQLRHRQEDDLAVSKVFA